MNTTPLHSTAEELASKGRNGDSMLMHVTPNEVGGLQALAQANGTSLTINPETGMPEAFILDTILPMAAGFALGPAGFGIMSSLAAAATVGGATALMTGDLGKGFSAGLGAYGGSNIGSALSNTGAQATNVAASEAAKTAAQTQAQSTLAGANLVGTPMTGPGLAGAANPINMANIGRTSASTGLTNLTAVQPGMSTVGAGVKDVFTEGGFGRLGEQLGKTPGGMIGTAAGLAAPLLTARPAPMYAPMQEEKSNYQGPYAPAARTARFPGADRMSTSEFQYFDDVNPYPSVRRLAEGGEVEGLPSAALAPTPQNLQDPQYIQQLLGGFGTAGQAGMNDRAAGMERGRALMPGQDYYLNTMGAGEKNYGVRPVTIKEPPPPQVQAPDTASFRNTSFPGMAGMARNSNPGIAGYARGPSIGGMRFGAPQPTPIAPKDESNYVDLSQYVYDPATQQMVPNFAEGGEVNLNDGSFVLDARTVSEIGNGSSDAGQEVLAQLGGVPVAGPGDGVSDSVPANIDGDQEARVARDEVIFSPQAVQRLGEGDPNAGAKKLYDLMERAHNARKKSKRGMDSGLGSLAGA